MRSVAIVWIWLIFSGGFLLIQIRINTAHCHYFRVAKRRSTSPLAKNILSASSRLSALPSRRHSRMSGRLSRKASSTSSARASSSANLALTLSLKEDYSDPPAEYVVIMLANEANPLLPPKFSSLGFFSETSIASCMTDSSSPVPSILSRIYATLCLVVIVGSSALL